MIVQHDVRPILPKVLAANAMALITLLLHPLHPNPWITLIANRDAKITPPKVPIVIAELQDPPSHRPSRPNATLTVIRGVEMTQRRELVANVDLLSQLFTHP